MDGIARIGAGDASGERVSGGLTGALVGGVAGAFLGPASFAAGALLGGALFRRATSEIFEIWTPGGQFATLRARNGAAMQARAWRANAVRIIAAADARAAGAVDVTPAISTKTRLARAFGRVPLPKKDGAG